MSTGFDTLISGKALNDFGFEAFDHVEGIGLLTFGFLWPADGIWAPYGGSFITTWANYTDLSGTTTWQVFSDLVSSTIWTPYIND